MPSLFCRVLPPATRFFTVSSPAFLSSREPGMIAPGMHAEVVVSFQPESLADYSDEILVGALVFCCLNKT